MNFYHILSEIEKEDPEVYDRLSTRRRAMRQFTGIAQRLSLTALPLALGSMFKKAYGQASNTVVLDVLNFALTAELLEVDLYTKATGSATLITNATEKAGFQLILKNETGHRDFVRNTITALGGTPIPVPTFDHTGGNGTGTGPFADVLSNYTTFLAVAQTYENTGMRAYKGRAPELIGAPDILEAALTLHSIEARHVAHIAALRASKGVMGLKPWFTGTNGGVPPQAQASYAGEDNTTQATIQIVGINGQTTIDANAATEAFDEPLTKDQVLAIIDPFIV
jgi:rubrerythrin